jgi:5-methylthioribose kinase
MDPAEWRAAHPTTFFLDAGDLSALARWLRAAGLLRPDETVGAATRAGEGNMNHTLRVVAGGRSLIVKQARPWVEKYPQFAAPRDRSLREREFYALAGARPGIAARLPRLLHADTDARVLVLEDLGTGGVYADVYAGASFRPDDIVALAQWLGELHRTIRDPPDRLGLANREMRELNGRHLFDIPLQPDNGLDLDAITPGLAALARDLREDAAFDAGVRAAAADYHSDGPSLLHGDFYPGSLLRTADGPCVIDPEFAYFGRPEYDPGVFLAHLWLARQPASLAALFEEHYLPPDGFDRRVMRRYAGVEIMRRLIGYAQLPLSVDLDGKRRLLGLARQLVVEPWAVMAEGA